MIYVPSWRSKPQITPFEWKVRGLGIASAWWFNAQFCNSGVNQPETDLW